MSTILKTERLFLREMDRNDYDALYRVLADSTIMQHYPFTFDESRVRDWIRRNLNRYQENRFGLWAVCLKDTGEMIGDCGLTLQNINGEMLPEIGYHIRRDCQRKGYAKEAAKAVRDWAFRNTDYPLFSSKLSGNQRGRFKKNSGQSDMVGHSFRKECLCRNR